MAICPNCTSENTGGRYCTECGAALPASCPACSSAVEPGQKFCGECGHQLAAGPARPPAPRPDIEAERRQITVMFCDMVGSTALSGRLDPEDLRDIMHTYQNTAAGAVSRFDGFVAKFLGDGVLAYFGFPQAHEDDAERAVRAGLAIVEAVSRLRAGSETQNLAVRVGISSGLVVVGDILEAGATVERSVIGETPNLAARLQEVAAPNTVVVSDATRKLIAGAFEFDDLGPKELKGIAGTVPAWRVGAESRAGSRFRASRAGALTEFVGRREEIDALLSQWRQASEGHGQAVVISGEAGIGKSRLVETLRQELSEEPHVRVRFQCSPYHLNTELFPIVSHLSYAAGIEQDDPAPARLDKLAALLSDEGDEASAQDRALIASLFGIHSDDGRAISSLSPEQRKDALLKLLAARMFALESRGPVLAVFEDVHWVDPTTLALLELSLTQVFGHSALIVITTRLEFEETWQPPANVNRLALERLPPDYRAEMIRSVATGRELPEALIAQIAERTDGVPLFVEELTRSVLESSASEATGDPTHMVSVPETLQDSLMERLDRLGNAKEVAQIGSAIGREFSYRMVAAVSDQPQSSLDENLQRLVNSGLVFERGEAAQARYIFKHALVQEAAHASMLLSRQRKLHLAIAQALVAHFPETETSQPELLARHYDLADHANEAVRYFELAGRKASAVSANAEAMAHFENALDRLPKLSAQCGGADEKIEFRLRAALGVPLIAVKGYASKEVEDNYLRAQAVASDETTSETYFAVLRGLWNCYFDRGDMRRGSELAAQLVRLAEQNRSDVLVALAYRAVGCVEILQGHIASADPAFDTCLAARKKLKGAFDLQAFGEDPGLISTFYQGWTKTIRGLVDEGLEHADEGVDAARAIGHPISIAFAESMRSSIQVWLENPARSLSAAENILPFCAEHQLVFWHAMAKCCKGWSMLRLGQQQDGMLVLQEGFADWQATGAALLIPYHNLLIMDGYLHCGQVNEALQTGAAALRACDRYGENLFHSEIVRLHGVAAASAGDEDKAVAYFERAIDEAASNGAGFFELRAMMDLAKLLRDRNQLAQAAEGMARCLAKVESDSEAPVITAARELYAALNAEMSA